MSFGKITRKNKSGIDVIPSGYSSVPSISSNQPIPTTTTVGNISDEIVDTNGDSHKLIHIEGGLYYWSSPKLRRIPLFMNAGLFDFSAKNLKNRKWVFPDGTTSTAERPAVTLARAGVVELEGDWDHSYFVELEGKTTTQYVGRLKDLHLVGYHLSLINCTLLTGSLADAPRVSYHLRIFNSPLLTGSLADAPRVSYYFDIYNSPLITGRLSDAPRVSLHLDLYNCNLLTGSLIDAPRVSSHLSLYNCNLITGTLADAPRVSSYLNLYNCNLITGVLADAPRVSSYLHLANCPLITGALPLTTIATYINIGSTGCTKPDVDLSLANLVAGHPSMSGAKTLILSGLKRTSASSANVATLISRGWTVTDATIEG